MKKVFICENTITGIYSGIYDAWKMKNWFLVVGQKLDSAKTTLYSEKERQMEDLWKGVCESISIRERENYRLQRQHLPLKYRKNMVEFA